MLSVAGRAWYFGHPNWKSYSRYRASLRVTTGSEKLCHLFPRYFTEPFEQPEPGID